MMARWLHTLQQFQFSIIHRAGRDHSNADGLSRAPISPWRQCTRPDCPTVDTTVEVSDQPFDAESLGDSEDADLVPMQSGEDWVAQLDDDLSRPVSRAGELFRITALQLADTTCVTLLEWIRSDTFPAWAEVKSLWPELRFLWHHRNNLSADTNGVVWRKRSSDSSQIQLHVLVLKAGRQELFLAYNASLFASRPACGFFFLCIIIKLFGLVCDRIGSPSDLVKSGGGGDVTVASRVPRREVGLTGHSIILYISAGSRALTIALCPVRVYKWRETGVYIVWWAATWSV